MNELGKLFNDWKKYKKQKKENDLEISIRLLDNNNIKYQKRNDGYHLIIVEGGIIINFWPSTGKFISRNKTGRGVFNLLKYIKECKMSK